MIDHLHNKKSPFRHSETFHYEKFKVSENSLIYKTSWPSILKLPLL
jgi:hypothetical protein